MITTNWFLIYVYRLITWYENSISKGVDEIIHIMVNTTFNLCCDRPHEIRDVERLEAALTEDEIAYYGSVGDVSLSMSDSGPSMSWNNIGPPQTYMDITDSTSSWTR
jgi:hypothetical protein